MANRDIFRFIIKPIAITFALVIVLPAIGSLAWYYSTIKERTATIPIDAYTALNFTVIWNWRMDQRVSISRGGNVIAEAGEEVFKKPYWSGGPLFSSKENSHYYIVLRFGAYDIDVISGTITHRCSLDADLIRNLSYLGQFSVKAIPRDSVRGEDVTFTPAGQRPPERSGMSSDDLEYKSLCG